MKKLWFVLFLILMFAPNAFAAYPSDSSRSKNWSSAEILTETDLESSFDELHTWVNAAMDATSGHKHDDTTNEGPKLAVLAATVSSDTAFSGDVSFTKTTGITSFLRDLSTSGDLVAEGDLSANGNLSVGDAIFVNNSKIDNFVVQIVNSQSGAVATGTTVMVDDDTIPQNTEGDEYYTVSITPQDSGNLLVIDALIHCAHSVSATTRIVALFQDSTADALAASYQLVNSDGNQVRGIQLRHQMTAGTTSSTTFKIRAGGTDAGTLTVNGASGARKLGGVLISGIRVTEYTV